MESEQLIELLLWVISGLGMVGVLLVGAIAYFMRSDRAETKQRLNAHDAKFERVHESIHEIALTTKIAIATMEQQIDNNTKTLEYMSKKKTR